MACGSRNRGCDCDAIIFHLAALALHARPLSALTISRSAANLLSEKCSTESDISRVGRTARPPMTPSMAAATAPATSIGWVSPASSRTTATRRRAVRLPGPDRARPTRIPERRNMEGSRPTFRSLRRLRRRTTAGHPRDIEGSCRSLPPLGGVQPTTVTSTRPPSSPPDHRHPHQTTVIPTRSPSSPPKVAAAAATAQTTRRPPKPRGDRPSRTATAQPFSPPEGAAAAATAQPTSAADSGRVDLVVQSLVWNQRTARVLASARVMPKWRWKRASSGSLVRGAFA